MDTRGSTYLETLIALPILFIGFVTLLLFGRLAVGHLVAQRAASAGARAAAVILPDDPEYYGVEGAATKEECVTEAVRRVLRATPFFALDDVRLKVEVRGTKLNWEPVTVRVLADYDCRSFIGSNSLFSRMLCGSDRIATFETRSTLSYQAGPLEK